MKINQITIKICCLFVIVFGTLSFYLDCLHIDGNNASIITGIFTGFIASLVIAIIGYLHEKEKIVKKTQLNLESLYWDLDTLHKITGNILIKIYKTAKVSELSFKNITSFAMQNIEFIESIELELFDSFFPKSKLSKVYIVLNEYKPKIYNLKNISSGIEALSLEIDTLSLQIDCMQLAGHQIDQINQLSYEINEKKNSLNIRTAKLHEYEASLILELDKIIESFYLAKKHKISWEDKKKAFIKDWEKLTTDKISKIS